MTIAVLVTGGAGYIGSHACKALHRAGFLPVTLDTLEEGHREAVRWGPLVEADIADRDAVAAAIAAHRIEAVLHFAAYINVGHSMQRPERYFRNNVGHTMALLETLHEAAIRQFVFSSTCAVYGEPVAIPITEANPTAPINAYGETKLMVEQMLRWHGVSHGLRSAALRYFNAAGADPEGETGERHDPETHLIPLILQAAAGERAAIDIYGTDYETPDGTAIRDYIHVQDLANAHVAALGYLRQGGGSVALNLGTGDGHSVREVIAAVEDATGLPVPSRDRPRRAGDPPRLVADSRKAQATLGWKPAISDLASIVGTAWAYKRSSATAPGSPPPP